MLGFRFYLFIYPQIAQRGSAAIERKREVTQRTQRTTEVGEAFKTPEIAREGILIIEPRITRIIRIARIKIQKAWGFIRVIRPIRAIRGQKIKLSFA